MVKIEATCPTCGTVECEPKDFELRLCNYTNASYYRFRCPSCQESIRKHADERAIEILIAEGIKPVRWTVPAEAMEPRNGAPITMDDLLDFMLQLSRPDFGSELLAG